MGPDNEFDFGTLADSITDAPDPIVPNAGPPTEEQLLNDPNFESRRRSIGEFLMDNPPRRGRPRKEKAEKPPKPKAPLPARRRGSLVKPLEQLYGALALALMPFDQVCATAVMNAAPKCAETLDALAYENEAVRRVLLSLVQTSVVGQVLLAHAPILMAIMMHHVPAVRDGFGAMVGQTTANEAEQWLANGNGDNAG